jgi:IS5 family transposase
VLGASGARARRPSLAIETYVRLMVIKQRSGWGYETLVREVSDSLHLRRFCRIALDVRCARRVDGAQAHAPARAGGRERDHARFDRQGDAREALLRTGGPDRLDGDRGRRQVPDRRWPGGARRARARQGGSQAGGQDRRDDGQGQGSLACDGAHAARDHAHHPSAQRAGQDRGAQAHRADRQAARALSPRSAAPRRPRARAKARGRGAQAKLRQAARLQELADRCAKVATQIRQRVAGEKIPDRLISLSDPDARPIRKGKLGKPNEFGYVAQLAEVTPNTKRGARGFILPAATAPGNPTEDTLLPSTAAELDRLGLRPREVALDGGFNTGPTNDALAAIEPERLFISGRQQPGSRRTQRRMQRYRTGAEGRISHLKRGYGLRRSRLKGDQGQRIWTGWATLAYNLDTHTRLT